MSEFHATHVVRVQCPHRIGLAYYDPEWQRAGDESEKGILSLLPCSCNATSKVLQTYRIVDESREVVLDPENDEDTRKLMLAVNAVHQAVALMPADAAVALRSLLPKPVIPPEPKDARAGIDAEGHTHLRLGPPGERHQPWTDGLGNWRAWEELAHPVTILRPEQPTGDEDLYDNPDGYRCRCGGHRDHPNSPECGP